MRWSNASSRPAHHSDLTLVFSTGQSDMKDKGLNRLGHQGLIRRVIGGYFGLSPRVERLMLHNRIEAYNLPEE
jgi:propionate CoA-transferase